MTIELPFSIGQRVKIREMGTESVVRSIRIDPYGLTFLVTYWHDGKMNEIWLFEEELEAIA